MPLYIYNDKKAKRSVAVYFIHIPKCAGTTLEKMFASLGFQSFLAPEDYLFARQYLKVPPTHFDIETIEKIFDLNKLYSFSIVRNPYNRILSDYKWAKEKSNRTEYFKAMSFDEFCSNSFEEYKIDQTYLASHIKPQHKFISNNVKKVFKLEDGLETAIQQVFADLGIVISGNILLPRLNATNENPIEISNYTRELIYDFYKEDFEMLGYEK